MPKPKPKPKPKRKPQPVTIMVHEYDGEPCREDPQEYLPTCVHGWRLIEVYTDPMYPPPG